MSGRRSRKGALLGLVVAVALVLVILGAGLLLMIMQLGGGQELQHATDAGNLNVAKQVLRRPGTALSGADEINHFGDSDDLATGEVNLLTINKLVAQTYLVSSNAQALGTTTARGHAEQMLTLLHGISDRLNTQLSSSSNFDGHFGNVAQNHAIRMFDSTNNPVFHVGTEHEISLMARGAATNVYLEPAQILAGGPALTSVTVSGPGGRSYLAGYTRLASNGSETLWGVPLRPGLPPHLVSQRNFSADQNRGLIPNYVPPNAFKSAGRATEQKASGNVSRAISMSLVGSLDTLFPGDIRRGVIIVDNTGSLSGLSFAGGFDIWQDKLMSPNYIEVLGPSSSSGLIADQSGGGPTLQDIKNFVNANISQLQSGDPNAQAQLAALLNACGIDSYGPFTSNPQALAADQGFISYVQNNIVTKCTNGALNHSQGRPPGSPNFPIRMATSGGQPCNVGTFVATFAQPGSPGTTGTPVNNLMAVEKFHVDICAERASGSECANIVASANNTGLKKYDDDDCGLTQIREGTLRELLYQTHAASPSNEGIITDLRTYMNQMKPGVSGGEVSNVLNSTVSFGRVSYIYRNPSTNRVVLSTSPPPWQLPDLTQPGVNLPDGTPETYLRSPNPFSLDAITNCSGECGYPHPWDCPLDSQATGQDTTVWTPSSGFRNILGVIRLRNSAAGGGQFCCPC
ncbi:MAG: hypothetical protein K2X93_04335 [Candidatus Obscuribacterales bacterium]|nr:hypothetical protein [Candidatus Obscuribacterales bacterium]